MDAVQLPARPSLEEYMRLAEDLVEACGSGNVEATRRVGKHYRLDRTPTRDELQAYVERRLRRLSGGGETTSRPLVLADAQLLVAQSLGFEGWPELAAHIDAINHAGSAESVFESAVDAVVTGDVAMLASLLRDHPQLIRARSTRQHHATLLHYVSANGVEDFRQQTPSNAVQVARLLLDAGAEVDAVHIQRPVEGQQPGTTLGLVATSVHPAVAGVQIALLETLLLAGAAVDGLPGGWNPLGAALANGRGDAAAFLATRGARLDLEMAAGVGRLDVVRGFFNEDGSLKETATEEQLLSGFTWACEYGRTSVVDFLLQKGVKVDERVRHDGQTGLHWAAFSGHLDTVELLLARGAPVNARDRSYDGTPLGWAIYGWGNAPPEAGHARYYEVVSALVAAGATADPEWLDHTDRGTPLGQRIGADPRMQAALRGMAE